MTFQTGDLVIHKSGKIGRVVENNQVAVIYDHVSSWSPISYYPPDVLTKFDEPEMFDICRHCDGDITLRRFGPPSSHMWIHVVTNLATCPQRQASPLRVELSNG